MRSFARRRICEGKRSEIHRIDYIQSNGKCWIETGVLNKNAKIEMKFTFSDDNTTDCLWCSRLNIDTSSFSAFIVGKKIRFDYGGEKTFLSDMTDNTSYVVMADGANIYVNGNLLHTATQPTSFTYDNIILLDSKSNSSQVVPSLAPNNNANIKLHYCKIWLGGALVRDFVPVLNRAGDAGLYDLVNQGYYMSPNKEKFRYG